MKIYEIKELVWKCKQLGSRQYWSIIGDYTFYINTNSATKKRTLTYTVDASTYVQMIGVFDTVWEAKKAANAKLEELLSVYLDAHLVSDIRLVLPEPCWDEPCWDEPC